MRCANHPEREASVRCNHCGQSICSDCHLRVKEENYCRECVNAKTSGETRVEHSPVLAAILSFVVAGLGQIYNGQYGKGLVVFFTSWLVIPWIIGIVDAYKTAVKIKDGQIIRQVKTGCIAGSLIAVFAGFFVAGLIVIGSIVMMSALYEKEDSPREERARATAKMISVAAENYARNHDGQFPSSEAQLVDEHYLTEEFGGVTKDGYIYTVSLSSDGYRIAAEPVICSSISEEIYTVTHTGGIKHSSCRNDREGE